MRDRAVAAQVFQIVDIDVPVVDFIAAPAQEIADHVLARPLRAAGRGDGDEVGRGGELRVEAAIYGVEDALLGVGIHCVSCPFVFIMERSKHTCPKLVETSPPFRITDVPLQFVAAQVESMWRGRMADNRVSDNKNVLYLIIGVLVVAVAVLGFNLYQAKKQPDGLQINVGPDGLKIQSK